MKKNILGFLGVALAMSACTEDYKDWVQPEQNTEQAEQTITLATPSVVKTAIDLASVTTDSIQLVDVTTTDDYTIKTLEFKFETEDGMSGSVPVDTRGYVSRTDLQKAIVTVFGYDIQERELDGKISGIGTANPTLVQTSGLDVILSSNDAVIIKATPAKVLYMIGEGCSWKFDNTTPLLMWNAEDSMYEGVAYISGYFKFTPQANWSQEYNCSNFQQDLCSSNVVISEGTGNIGFSGNAGNYNMQVNPDTHVILATPAN